MTSLLCLRVAGPTSGVSRYLPPNLDINGSYIDIAANSTLRITCYGRYPLAWALPPLGDKVSLRSSVIEEELDGVRPFKSVFELNTTDVMDLGLYTCYYKGTTDLTNTENATSVYVFVYGPTLGVSRYLPPKLDINGSYIDIAANSTLRITCYGRYPLAWALPPFGDKVSLRSSVIEEELDGVRPFKSVFELNTTDVMDLGRYTCYYNGTTDLTNTGNATSVYVFVNDDYHLLQPQKQMDQLVSVTMRHGKLSVVPCLPTHSGAKVQLWKDLGQGKMEEVSTEPYHVEFDPMRGFIMYYPYSYYAGHFVCNGSVPGRVYNDSSMAMVFVYLPNPVVAVVNDTELFAYGANFTLVCTVKGSQPLFAWWEWRECAEPRACDKQSPSGLFSELWPDSLHHTNSPGDGTPLMHSAEGRGHLNVTLRLRAKQSGLYRCVGSNWEGEDRSIAKFYVTGESTFRFAGC
ncbi:hypothetical protein V5799_031754 [Amblyomma americanum]|uniref:Platelet-derived growth factor receptor-like protein n=1 Tax=Amblyomma americanum TaxID=6943 RepID=A0AAQ4DT48_AMBAM